MDSWIADVVGLMHIHGITQITLAEHMGVTNDYISMILRGKKKPDGVEQRIRHALEEIISGVKEPD